MSLVLDDCLDLQEIRVDGFEKVIKVTDNRVGLTGIIAIHDTSMGPALGGMRVYPYASFDQALSDALRLSNGMTYKSTLAKVGFGGGKSVIIADPKMKTKEMLISFAKAVDTLQGQYILAADMGSTPDDMRLMAQHTPYVVGLAHEKSSGNPSPYTAWGVFKGIQSVCTKLFNTSSVEGKTVAIQGLGSVGENLGEFLFWHGAKLIVSDINQEKAAMLAHKWGAVSCNPDEIFRVDCDIFAPCAMGGVINNKTISHLTCRAVAGAANNQLLLDTDADLLRNRGILYAPDFVINSGGLINVSCELSQEGYRPNVARQDVDGIYSQLLTIYDIAEQNRYSTLMAAYALARYSLKYKVGKRVDPITFHHANVII